VRSRSDARSRDASADQSAASTAKDGGSNTKQSSDDGATVTPESATVAVKQAATKSSPSKDSSSSSAQPLEKPSTEKKSLSAPDVAGLQAVASVPIAIAVAVPIPVTIAFADTPAAAPASSSATAPLAIATAAATVAAGASAVPAPALPTPDNIVSEAAAASTSAVSAAAPSNNAPGEVAANPATAADSEKAVLVEAAGQSIATPVKQTAQVAPLNAPPVSDAGFIAVAEIAAAIAPKAATSKEPVSAPSKAVAPGTPDTNLGASDRSAASADLTAGAPNVQQPAAAKPEASTDIHDKAKSDGAILNASATNDAAPARDHVPLTSHPSIDPPAPGNETIGAPQPTLLANAGAAPPPPSLNVLAASNAAVPLSGLAFEIAASARSGKSRFEIRLDPADLGRIDVRIDVDRTGQVTSHLTVEKPETLSLLRQDAPQLQRALDDAGFKTGDGGLQFSLRDQSSSGQNTGNETSRNAQRLVITDDETIPAAIAGRSYGRVLGSTSGVDIRV